MVAANDKFPSSLPPTDPMDEIWQKLDEKCIFRIDTTMLSWSRWMVVDIEDVVVVEDDA